MSTEEKREPQAQKELQPLEFQQFHAAVKKIPTGSSLDTRITAWASMLALWQQYLAQSTHQKQAYKLLFPLLENYAASCFERFQTLQQPQDLDRAIDLYAELVAKSTAIDQKDASYSDNLGRLYFNKYTLTQEISHLEAAIDIYQHLFQEAPDNTIYQDNLRDLAQRHYHQTHSLQDLEWLERVSLYTIKATTDAELRAQHALFLGQIYKEQYRVKKDLFALANSIHYLERASSAQNTECRSSALYQLGFLLRERGTVTENPDELRHALAIWKQVLAILPAKENRTGELLVNIGALYRKLFELSIKQADVEEAISFFQQVVEKVPESPVLADCLSFLSYSLFIHYDWSQDIADLNAAVTHLERNLEIQTTQEQRAQTLYNLGHTLKKRFQASENTEDMQRAMKLIRESEKIERELA